MKFAKQVRKRRGEWLECETCKTVFYVFPERLRRPCKTRYCSKKCYDKKGENGPFYGKKHSPGAVARMVANPNRHRFSKGGFGHDIPNPNDIRFGPEFRGTTKTWWRRFLKATIGKCERCNWCETPDILQLHHKDRNTRNNKRENLELLCPICHELDHLGKRDGRYAPGRGFE